MKKRVIALLSSAFLLYACGEETESEPTEPGSDQVDEAQLAEEETVDETDTEEEPSEENDDADVEEVTEEEFLYEVSDDHSYIHVIDGVEANDRAALLTYDDVPDNYAMEIAEILQEYNAPAIFFVNGMYIEDQEGQDTIEKIYNMGFEIGNHTQTHANLQQISEEQQYEEIMQTSDLIEEVTGERPRFFRAPHGANTDFATQTAYENGMMLMNWTYGYDYFEPYMEADKLAEAMITGEAPEIDINYSLLAPGANLLMHDREWTMEATPAIIEGLREQEYELVDPALIRSVELEDQEESEDVDE